jgi:hypothetical protein
MINFGAQESSSLSILDNYLKDVSAQFGANFIFGEYPNR